MAVEAEGQLPTAEICRLAEITPVAADVQPEQFLARLVSEQRFPDAVRFLVQTLQADAAVRWACECVRNLQQPDAAEEQKAALRAAEAWLASPDETTRRATKDAADQAGLDTPEGVLAMAVFFSGGSVAPETAPEVPAPARACHRLSAGAVMLAVVSSHPENAPERFQQAIQLGRSSEGDPARAIQRVR
jgi:hypothetical protein